MLQTDLGLFSLSSVDAVSDISNRARKTGGQMDRLRTLRAQALYKAMADAREAVDKAHESYHDAFLIAADTNVNPDGAHLLRTACTAYAQAVNQFSHVAMDWLVFVDTELHSRKQ
jgi:hypothetical protein